MKEDNIEKLRSKLNKTVNPENLLDQEVIDLSQELDKEIVRSYKREGGTEMPGIFIKKDRIMFYGNAAGYIDNDKAVVDPMFQCKELKDFLTEKQGLSVEWVNGVYDRLANGNQELGEQTVLKACRIYQLKPEVNPMMKFIGYDELLKDGFGEPDPENYQMVYDGEIETNDLEAIFVKFNLNHPADFQGHSLSMSDVIELYDKDGSEFHYVDRFGFKQIEFSGPEQQQQGQTMKI